MYQLVIYVSCVDGLIIDAESFIQFQKCLGKDTFTSKYMYGNCVSIVTLIDKRGIDASNRKVFVKIYKKISKSNRFNEFVCAEVASLIMLNDSEHVVDIYHAFEDDKNIYLVLEFCEGGDLFDYVKGKSLSEESLLNVFYEMVTCVYDVHKASICHRDIKLENFVLDGDGNLKLCDLGQCGFLMDDAPVQSSDVVKIDGKRFLTRKVGTVYYASPAVVNGSPYRYLEDVWSLGICLFAMTTKKFPFYGNGDDEVEKRILEDKLPVSRLPSKIRSIISVTLKRNRNNRYSLLRLKAYIEAMLKEIPPSAS